LTRYLARKAKFGPLEKGAKTISIEIKFFRTAGYILFNHEKTGGILEELRVKPVDEELRRCKSNWLRHVTGMKSCRMAKIMLN
jgi:hypothetical protein